MSLRLFGLALLAGLCTGCLSTGEQQVLMTCDPSVVERCVPVRAESAVKTRTPAGKPKVPPSTRSLAGKPPVVRNLSTPARRFARFRGEYFSVNYPTGWLVETAEVSKGAYLDTTIRSPRTPATYLRVDVTPRLGLADPARHALRAERYLLGQPGYRRLAFRRTVLGSWKALRWEFTVRESGVLLRKVDIFLIDSEGNSFAILTQAPAQEFRHRRPLFERLVASVVPSAAAGVIGFPASS